MSNKRPPDGPTRDRSPPSKRRLPPAQPVNPAKSNPKPDLASRQRVNSGPPSSRNSQEPRQRAQNGGSESPAQGAPLAPNMVPAANTTRAKFQNYRERYMKLKEQAPPIDAKSDDELIAISTAVLRDFKALSAAFEEFKKDQARETQSQQREHRKLEEKVTAQAAETAELKGELKLSSTGLKQANVRLAELEKKSKARDVQEEQLKQARETQDTDFGAKLKTQQTELTALKTQQVQLVAQQVTSDTQQTKLEDLVKKQDAQQQTLDAQQKTQAHVQNIQNALQKLLDAQRKELDAQQTKVGALEDKRLSDVRKLAALNTKAEAQHEKLEGLEKEPGIRHEKLEDLERNVKAHTQAMADGIQTQLNTEIQVHKKFRKDLSEQRTKDNKARESKIELLNQLKKDVTSLAEQRKELLEKVNDLAGRLLKVETAGQPDGPSMEQYQEHLSSTRELLERIQQLEAKRQTGTNAAPDAAPHTNITEDSDEYSKILTDFDTLFDGLGSLQEAEVSRKEADGQLKQRINDLSTEVKVLREGMREAISTVVDPIAQDLETMKSQQVSSAEDISFRQELEKRDLRISNLENAPKPDIIELDKKLRVQDTRLREMSTTLSGKLDGNDLQIRDNQIAEISQRLSDKADYVAVTAMIHKRDGNIAELEKKMAIRVNQDAIEGQFSNIRLAVRNLEDRYNSITTDTIYDGMMRSFLSRFPNTQAQLVQQVAELRDTVQRIGGLHSIANQLQDLHRKTANLGDLQQTLQKLNGDAVQSRRTAQTALDQVRMMETKMTEASKLEERITNLESRPAAEETNSTAFSNRLIEMRSIFSKEQEIRVNAEKRISDVNLRLKTNLEAISEKAGALEKSVSDVQKYIDDTIKPRENFFEYSQILLPCVAELQKAVEDLNRGQRSPGLLWGHDLGSLFVPE